MTAKPLKPQEVFEATECNTLSNFRRKKSQILRTKADTGLQLHILQVTAALLFHGEPSTTRSPNWLLGDKMLPDPGPLFHNFIVYNLQEIWTHRSCRTCCPRSQSVKGNRQTSDPLLPTPNSVLLFQPEAAADHEGRVLICGAGN